MARTPVLAAGGIVLRPGKTPLIAVVRLRKRNEWVLPKGKLDAGETPRAAAEREVREETGHDVRVHEFLGTLVYEVGGGSKVVHFWRMEAAGEQVHELMDDVKAVAWLTLDEAVERLSRGHERAFLANVGPLALETAATALARLEAGGAPAVARQSSNLGSRKDGSRPPQKSGAEGAGLAAAGRLICAAAGKRCRLNPRRPTILGEVSSDRRFEILNRHRSDGTGQFDRPKGYRVRAGQSAFATSP